MEGFPEKLYRSNFEALIDALTVRVNPRHLPTNNCEEPISALQVIENAFKRIDAFGLRLDMLERDQETQ